MTVLADVSDPDGRRVELTAERWAHILEEHGEMAAHREALLETVAAPEHRTPILAPCGSATGGRGSDPAGGCWWS